MCKPRTAISHLICISQTSAHTLDMRNQQRTRRCRKRSGQVSKLTTSPTWQISPSAVCLEQAKTCRHQMLSGLPLPTSTTLINHPSQRTEQHSRKRSGVAEDERSAQDVSHPVREILPESIRRPKRVCGGNSGTAPRAREGHGVTDGSLVTEHAFALPCVCIWSGYARPCDSDRRCVIAIGAGGIVRTDQPASPCHRV